MEARIGEWKPGAGNGEVGLMKQTNAGEYLLGFYWLD